MSKDNLIDEVEKEKERVTEETLRSIRRRNVSTTATSALHQKKYCR